MGRRAWGRAPFSWNKRFDPARPGRSCASPLQHGEVVCTGQQGGELLWASLLPPQPKVASVLFSYFSCKGPL